MKTKLFLIVTAMLLISGCTVLNPTTPTNSIPAPKTNILDLSNKNLTKLPDYVLQQTNLEELNLSNNQLTGALPAEIRALKNLKILNMSHNFMTGIPAEIGQLQNLETLDLASNQFTGLPNELGNLKKLKTLILSGNNYSTQDLATIEASLSKTVNIIK